MRVRNWAGAIGLFAVLSLPSVGSAQGLYIPGAGAIQGGMGGASTATPLDAIGALYWNPAAISRLGHSEMSLSGNVLFPSINASSSFPQPGVGIISGGTHSDSGVPLASSVGLVYQPDDSPFTYATGLFTLAGAGVNFPGTPGNPILSSTGPLGKTIIGPIYSNMTMLQVNPTMSYKVTDKLAIGVGPTIDADIVSFNPAFFASPNQNFFGQNVFPSATNSRPFWGGGFRVGAVYSITDTLDAGFGFTSKQWLETWQFNASDLLGNPRTLNLNAQLPAIYSWGLAYRGIDRLTLAVDMRYFDYKNTELFGEKVINGGLGWDSVFAVAVGAHYQLTDRIATVVGYQYNTNPIPTTATLFNVQAPAILQNTVSVGGVFNVTEALFVALGYSYSFSNSITGEAKEIPGASVKLSASGQSALFNVGVKFGGGSKRPCCSGCSADDVAAISAPPTQSVSTTMPPAATAQTHPIPNGRVYGDEQ